MQERPLVEFTMMELQSIVSSAFVFIHVLSAATAEIPTKSFDCEDEFIQRFGNLPYESYIPWENASKWDKEENRIALMNICNEAHGLRVKGSYFIQNVVFIAGVKLVFKNPAYNSIFIDIMEFKSRADERNIPGHAKNLEELVQYQTWHITRGLKPECVFYLTTKDQLGTVELMEHVCGLSWYFS